jgi:uncharacterized 2Fe-2S/4Fe-4S cluster protein (DUF4445 family)
VPFRRTGYARKGKKEITKEERKQIKADIANLQKLIIKAKPDKITDSDISAVREAISQLRSSSANACRIAGIDQETTGEI